jgi:hypothetical protein
VIRERNGARYSAAPGSSGGSAPGAKFGRVLGPNASESSSVTGGSRRNGPDESESTEGWRPGSPDLGGASVAGGGSGRLGPGESEPSTEGWRPRCEVGLCSITLGRNAEFEWCAPPVEGMRLTAYEDCREGAGFHCCASAHLSPAFPARTMARAAHSTCRNNRHEFTPTLSEGLTVKTSFPIQCAQCARLRGGSALANIGLRGLRVLGHLPRALRKTTPGVHCLRVVQHTTIVPIVRHRARALGTNRSYHLHA